MALNASTDPSENRVFGLVLRSHASGEADMVLRLLTDSLGKIAVFARNARRSKKRFTGNVEMFDSGVFEIRRGRGTLIELVSFTPHSTLKEVRVDFDKLAAASLLCECTDLLVKEEQGHKDEQEKIFTDIDLGLRAIEEAHGTIEICRAVFLSLSSLLITTGFLDHNSSRQPSAQNLLMLLKRVEDSSERELISKQAFIGVLKTLKRAKAT